MTAIEALEQVIDYISKKKDKVYNDMGYANDHKFYMESMGLQYKADVLSDIDTEVSVMLHKLYQEEK